MAAPLHSPLDMLVFAKVVECQNFSVAARRLGISRSAASKHVTRLEQRLGARLLNRTTRKLSLTEAGRSAFAHCARIAAEVEASELAVQPFVRRPQGLVRVSAPNAFGRQHLVPILPEYLARHPDVSIELVLNDRLVDMVEERFDVAISSYPLARGNLIQRQFAPIDWVICATPAYLRRHGMPAEPDDLAGHNCIYFTSAAVRGDVWVVTRSGESRAVRVGGNFRANSSEAVRDAALCNLGIALLPTFAIWQEITAGALVRVLPQWTPEGTLGNNLTAHFIADRHLTPKIRTLVDFLVERFKRFHQTTTAAAGGAQARSPAVRRPKTVPRTAARRR